MAEKDIVTITAPVQADAPGMVATAVKATIIEGVRGTTDPSDTHSNLASAARASRFMQGTGIPLEDLIEALKNSGHEARQQSYPPQYLACLGENFKEGVRIDPDEKQITVFQEIPVEDVSKFLEAPSHHLETLPAVASRELTESGEEKIEQAISVVRISGLNFPQVEPTKVHEVKQELPQTEAQQAQNHFILSDPRFSP